MNWRIPMAIVGTAAIYTLLQAVVQVLAPEPATGHPPDLVLPTLITAAIMFVAVAFGAWMAQGRFLVAALVWAVFWRVGAAGPTCKTLEEGF